MPATRCDDGQTKRQTTPFSFSPSVFLLTGVGSPPWNAHGDVRPSSAEEPESLPRYIPRGPPARKAILFSPTFFFFFSYRASDRRRGTLTATSARRRRRSQSHLRGTHHGAHCPAPRLLQATSKFDTWTFAASMSGNTDRPNKNPTSAAATAAHR